MKTRPEDIRIHRVASAILYTPRRELLLQQRDDKPGLAYPATWTPFGGQIEPGEDPHDGIRRELLEELELDVPLTQWRMFPCPVRTKPGELVCMHYSYMGLVDRPIEDYIQHEGQGRGYYRAHEIAALDIAFGQKELLLDFCAVYFNEDAR